jgi:hypothetical protein
MIFGGGGIFGNLIGQISDNFKAKREMKRAIELKKLEIIQTKETADIEWEKIMAEASKDSWKDEFWTVIFGFILLVPIYDPQIAISVFTAFDKAPEWFQYSFMVAVGASFGVKVWKGFK